MQNTQKQQRKKSSQGWYANVCVRVSVSVSVSVSMSFSLSLSLALSLSLSALKARNDKTRKLLKKLLEQPVTPIP